MSEARRLVINASSWDALLEFYDADFKAKGCAAGAGQRFMDAHFIKADPIPHDKPLTDL